MIDLLSDPQIWASFITLTAMEIILGIDNIVFIAVIVSRLEGPASERARQIGLAGALIMRILLLLALAWLIGLTEPIVTLFGQPISWRSLILMAGGLFLLAKATREIHHDIEGDGDDVTKKGKATFWSVIVQIMVIDMVFSVDSIVTAIGIADYVEVMIAAVVVSMVVMYVASIPIAKFIQQHPTTKMLALSFLILIGAALVADGVGFHIPRGYIYFSMAFATTVEAINIIAARRRRARARANG